MSTEAENWLQVQYPELVELWQNSYLSNNDKSKQFGEECIICRIRSNTGSHYGVFSCEADKQFLKRTFHDKQVYPVCHLQCPPRFRGWCQYCRLKSSLSSGINIKMIRTSYNLKRTRSKQSIAAESEPSPPKRAKSQSASKDKKMADKKSDSSDTDDKSGVVNDDEPMKKCKTVKRTRRGRNQIKCNEVSDLERRDTLSHVKREVDEEITMNHSPNYPGWDAERQNALDMYYSHLNYLKMLFPGFPPNPHSQPHGYHPNPHSQLPVYPRDWPHNPPDYQQQNYERLDIERRQENWSESSNGPLSPPNSCISSPPSTMVSDQHKIQPARPTAIYASQPTSFSTDLKFDGASSQAKTSIANFNSTTRQTMSTNRRERVINKSLDLSSISNNVHSHHIASMLAAGHESLHQQYSMTAAIQAHTPGHMNLSYPAPSYMSHAPGPNHITFPTLDSIPEVLRPPAADTPDSVDALHPQHYLSSPGDYEMSYPQYLPSPPYTNSERCVLSPMQTEPIDLSSSSGSNISSRPSSRCSSRASMCSRPPSAGTFPSPRSEGTCLNKLSVNSTVLQEALSIIEPGLSLHASLKNISHISDILSESTCG